MLEAVRMSGAVVPGVRPAVVTVPSPLFLGVPVQWGAICAGITAGLSLQLLLMLLGMLATQVSTEVFPGARNDTIGNLLWNGYSMLIAVYLSAYVGVRLSGLKRKMDGILHGIVTAAAAILLSLMLAPTVGAPLLHTIYHALVPAGSQGNGQPVLSAVQSISQAADTATDAQVLAARSNNGRNTFSDDGVEAVPLESDVIKSYVPPETVALQFFSTEERTSEMLQFSSWILVSVLMLSMILGGCGGLIGALSMQRHPWISPNSGNR